MDAQQFAQQLQQRKEKNLAFFKRYFPSIYEKFHGLKLKNSQLNIDSNTLEVNILEQGQALYPLDANAFNQKEALTFSDAFKPGSFNHPISRSTPDAFYRGRFFHGSLANFLEAVQPVAEVVDEIEREFAAAQARFAAWRPSAAVARRAGEVAV